MKVNTIRKPLRLAAEEINSAREQAVADDHSAYLDGLASQLEYYLEGDTTDPEAHIYPPPGALDTIQHQLTEAIEQADDPVADHLRNARGQLLMVIMTLDEQMTQGRGPID